ncbi:MAG: hypothetical protein AVDCRST_MAG49-1108, partial [uncultured Thermomicrobiales bacterium]
GTTGVHAAAARAARVARRAARPAPILGVPRCDPRRDRGHRAAARRLQPDGSTARGRTPGLTAREGSRGGGPERHGGGRRAPRRGAPGRGGRGPPGRPGGRGRRARWVDEPLHDRRRAPLREFGGGSPWLRDGAAPGQRGPDPADGAGGGAGVDLPDPVPATARPPGHAGADADAGGAGRGLRRADQPGARRRRPRPGADRDRPPPRDGGVPRGLRLPLRGRRGDGGGVSAAWATGVGRVRGDPGGCLGRGPGPDRRPPRRWGGDPAGAPRRGSPRRHGHLHARL